MTLMLHVVISISRPMKIHVDMTLVLHFSKIAQAAKNKSI